MLTLLLIPLAASLALIAYRRLEARGERTWIPMLLRAIAWGGLGALLVNPSCPGPVDTRPPLVLLDASLSMLADSAHWSIAVDTARSLGRVRWFGDARPWTDSVPGRGQSDLAPSLAAASAIGRQTVVVTDGELDDLGDAPADLLASTGFVVLPRTRGRDLAVRQVRAPARATVGDTIIVNVEISSGGTTTPESVSVLVRAGPRVIGRTTAILPPDGSLPLRVAAATRGVAVGTQFLTVGIEAAADAEPRDDARLVAVDFSGTPGIVLLASPGDWDARFLYRTLRDVADLPVKGFVRLDGERWRDMDGLAVVGAASVRASAAGADLLIVRGEAPALVDISRARGLLRWPEAESGAGEWYASAAPVSPVALAFLGVPVDSLPPLTGIRTLTPAAGDWVGLMVQLGRRGAVRPVMVGKQLGRRREVVLGADGLWRWGFRGGPSADVYRALVAAAVSWLLAEPDAGSSEARILQRVTEQGMPLTFERANDSLTILPITFEQQGREQLDTLRFGGDGRASIWLSPGIYRYRLGGPRGGTGVAAVDSWSREWLPREAVVSSRPVPAAGAGARRSARQSAWLYLLVLLSLAGEWLARRRLGLR
ncbi:MAG: hypothetical protein R2910_06660 [Gemmatimonadales bacterium]